MNANEPTLPIETVCFRLGVSRYTLDLAIREGRFAKPSGKSGRRLFWREADVRAGIASRISPILPPSAEAR